jgi:superfamily II DNA or RNA helicase
LDAWVENKFFGCFEVATGGGKTMFALLAIKELLRIRPNTRCLVVVPTTALLDQWFLTFQDEWGLADSEIKVLRGSDLIPDAFINLVVINTARRLQDFDFSHDEILLIIDECHRAGSIKNSQCLIPGTLGAIGLSATPFRDFDDGFQDYVEPVLGPILLKYTLQDAINDGVLVDLKLTYVKVPFLGSEQRRYDDLSRRIALALNNKDISQERLEAILRQRARVYNNAFYRLPATASILESNRGKRALVFVEAIEKAQELRETLEGLGHSVTIYHSKISDSFRRSNLRGFRSGIFDVLIACRALDEGFNVPEAELAVIAAGTSSKRQRIQRIGRILRTLSGKNLGEVYTLYCSPVEERRLILEAEEFESVVLTRWSVIEID